MATAPTIDQVKSVLPTSTALTDLQIQQAIDASGCQITQIEMGCASYLTDSCLTQVWTYLAAHFAAVTENSLAVKSESDDCCDSAVVYSFKFGDGVLGTSFGILANSLSGGCLQEFDKRPANLFSIGSVGNC